MSIFGDLAVRLDPWQVDYGAELQLDEADDPDQDETVAIDVELAPEEWRPISPGNTAPPAHLIFVDGVRRIEARLIIRQHGRVYHGAFGSHAVGAVRVTGGAASCAAPRVGRLIVIGSGNTLDGPIVVAPGLNCEPVGTFDTDPDAPLRTIQESMRIAEERLGKELADSEDTLVVADGPLTFEEASRGAVLGYIKRIFKLYLPRERLDLLVRLAAGERTPIFALRSSRRFVRFSWFLRLAPPQPGDSELAGIARLEVSETVGTEVARALADASTALLPRFAPGRWSPQNLLPIGALEASLRRHLGDGRLIRRYIETLIAGEAPVAETRTGSENVNSLGRATDAIGQMPELRAEGLILGSQDATPLEFWVGVLRGRRRRRKIHRRVSLIPDARRRPFACDR